MAHDHSGLSLASDDFKPRLRFGAWRRFARNKMAVLGLFIVGAMFFVGIFAPWLAPYDPTAQNLDAVEQLPNPQHWLGTDELGRDQLSRIIWGARTAVVVVIAATLIYAVLGILMGSLAGFFGGWVDTLIMRISDVLFAFPGLLFAFFVAATIKPSVIKWIKSIETSIGMKGLARSGFVDYLVVIAALSVVGWPGLARLVRGQFLSLKEREFVEAARAVGVTSWGIMTRHLMPNAMPPVVVALSMGMGGTILSEAILSFLGLGIQPPAPSWGAMIYDNYSFWRSPAAPVLLWLPGLIIGAIVFAFNFIGDGLNDALNPHVE